MCVYILVYGIVIIVFSVDDILFFFGNKRLGLERLSNLVKFYYCEFVCLFMFLRSYFMKGVRYRRYYGEWGRCVF